jgi:hypothetical protein
VDDRVRKPVLYSPDWWQQRAVVMDDIAKSQARMRKAHPIPGDNIPELQAARVRASDCAMAIALHGNGPNDLPLGVLENEHRLACSILAELERKHGLRQ